MYSRRTLYAMFSILIMTLFAASCSELSKANKLTEEGNAAVKEAEKLALEADQKMNQLGAGMANFPDGRDQLKGTSQEVNDLLDKGIAKLREAEKKFSDGSKMDVDAPLKEYLSVKAQEFGKHAEHFETLKDLPKAIMDPSIKDRSALDNRFVQIRTRVEKLEKEWTDLGARANQIYEANKSKFQS